MPSPEELEILIRTTAVGDGAKKAEGDLKKLNEEAKKSEPVWKSASERIAEAEANTAQMGATAGTAAGAGVGALAGAAALAAAGVGILASSVAGLNKLAPTLGESFKGIGGAIKDSFLEVMGGSLKTAIEDVFGVDFEQKLQRIAEAFGAATAKMKLMGEASADYISNQKTLVDLLRQENEQREIASTAAANRAHELREEIKLQEELNKARREEEKAAIDRDSRLPAGEKARAKEHVDIMGEHAAKQAADEQRQSRLDEINRKEREAAERYIEAEKRDKAAEAISRGDYLKAGDLPADQAQKIKDAQGRLAAEDDPKKASKIRDEIAALLKVFEDAREKARLEFEKQVESARAKREAEDIDARREQEAYDRKQRERDRDAPANEAKREIADAKSGIGNARQEEKRADSELAEQIKKIESDPKFQAGDTRGETKAALDKIVERMQRGADTEEDLKQLAEIMSRIEPAVGQQGKEAIAAANQQLNMLKTVIGLIQTLNQEIKQTQSRLDQLQSQVDS